MARRLLYCTRCNHGIVVEAEVPAQCSKCGSSAWRSATHPSTPYTLTHMDKRFLRSIHIDSEDAPPAD